MKLASCLVSKSRLELYLYGLHLSGIVSVSRGPHSVIHTARSAMGSWDMFTSNHVLYWSYWSSAEVTYLGRVSASSPSQNTSLPTRVLVWLTGQRELGEKWAVESRQRRRSHCALCDVSEATFVPVGSIILDYSRSLFALLVCSL
jgi:hypothetical protein